MHFNYFYIKSDIDMTESESRTPDGSFLSPSSENVKVDEILEKYKTNCSRHKIVDMAKFLGINRNTLTKKISRAKAVVTNIKKDPNLCHFCENTVSPNISKSTKHTKMDSIIDSIKDLSYYEKSSEISILCQVAVKMLYLKNSKRKLAQVFKGLGENPDNFMNSFKFKVPLEAAIQYKTSLKMTKVQYKKLKCYLSEYLILPSYKKLAKKIDELMPSKEGPKDFFMGDDKIGQYWPPLDVIKDTIKEILEVFHGQCPEKVPDHLWIIGTYRVICS